MFQFRGGPECMASGSVAGAVCVAGQDRVQNLHRRRQPDRCHVAVRLCLSPEYIKGAGGGPSEQTSASRSIRAYGARLARGCLSPASEMTAAVRRLQVLGHELKGDGVLANG